MSNYTGFFRFDKTQGFEIKGDFLIPVRGGDFE